MKKYSKAGLLIITLVIPALIFVFLRLFGTNHYKVPVFHPLKEKSGAVRVVGTDTVYYHIDTRISGEAGAGLLKVAGWKGHLTVVSYLPEVCDDTCRLVQANLSRIYALREEIHALRLVTIATDKRPVSEGGKEGWSYAVFSPAAIDSVLYGDLKLREIEGGVTPGHNVILVDEWGRIRGYYNGADSEEMDRLMAEIKILDYERSIE